MARKPAKWNPARIKLSRVKRPWRFDPDWSEDGSADRMLTPSKVQKIWLRKLRKTSRRLEEMAS